MQKRSLLLVLAVGGLWAAAVAQEIVIEPTNGRPQSSSGSRASRPVIVNLGPIAKPNPPSEIKHEAKPAAKPVAKINSPEHGAPKQVTPRQAAKHIAEKQVAAKTEAAPVPSSPATAEIAKNGAPPAVTPAPKKFPMRPAWATPDTRDGASVQSEIANALARDPRLAGSFIQVKVEEDSIILEGHAAGRDERLQAERLAQSYAWNRKLVDHVEIVPRISAQK
jgi:hypothetical protein